MIGSVPDHEPLVALSVWPSTRLPSTSGALPADGSSPAITPVRALASELDPATLVAVTTTFTVSPIRPVTSCSVGLVAFESSVHFLPAALHSNHW